MNAVRGCFLVLAFFAEALAQEGRGLLIRAARIIPVDGAPIENGAVLVERGKITGVGTALERPEGAELIEIKDGVVFPGFVDGASFLGLRRHKDEIVRASNPELDIADAIDSADPGFERAQRAGITTMHLMPGDANVVGGWSAVVKADLGVVRDLRRFAALKISLSQSSYAGNREPTSFLGGVELANSASRDVRVIKRLEARAAVVIAADQRPEIAAALGLKDHFKARPIFQSGAQVREEASRIAATQGGVILRAILPEAPDRDREAAKILAQAGVTFAFSTEAPARPPESLRLSAVLATVAGLEPGAAHRALTIGPARLLGVEERVGSITVGKDADLVVFSHDPTDARARVLLVIQDGRVAYRPKE